MSNHDSYHRKRNSGCLGCLGLILSGITSLCMVLILAFCGYYVWTHYLADKTSKMESIETIFQAEEASTTETAYMEGSEVYYYYSTLKEDQKKVYKDILAGLNSMEESIKLHTSKEDLEEIYAMVYADHPEIFWATNGYSYLVYPTSISLNPNYTVDSLAAVANRQNALETEIDKALSEIEAKGDGYDAIKASFEYIIDTVSYEPEAEDNQNIYSALVHKKSVCAGYARSLQYLLQKQGFMALYVTGSVKNPLDHAWTMVRYKDKFYHIDATYGDTSYTANASDYETMPQALDYDYYYLCASDNEIYRGRSKSGELPLPACPSDDLNYYKYKGKYFEAYGQDVTYTIEESIARGENYWEGQFSNESAYGKMKEEVMDGLYGNLIMEYSDYRTSVRSYYSYDDENYTIRLWY